MEDNGGDNCTSICMYSSYCNTTVMRMRMRRMRTRTRMRIVGEEGNGGDGVRLTEMRVTKEENLRFREQRNR